jgi:hypothetical protein
MSWDGALSLVDHIGALLKPLWFKAASLSYAGGWQLHASSADAGSAAYTRPSVYMETLERTDDPCSDDQHVSRGTHNPA